MDTLYGEINYQGEMLNGKSCQFRPTGKETKERFKPGDIYGYRFSNDHFYVSKLLPLEEGDQMVFARYIVDGITSLYLHRGSSGDVYYIEDQEGVLLELDNQSKAVIGEYGGEKIQHSTKYIGVLKYAMQDQPQIFGRIEKLKVKEDQLIDLMSDYHEMVCGDSIACMVYTKEKEPLKIAFGVIAEYYRGSLRIEGNVYDISQQPVSEIRLGAGISFPMPLVNHRIHFSYKLLFNTILESQLLGNELVTKAATYSYSNHINLAWIENNISLAYHFSPKSKMKPFILLGGFHDYGIRHSIDTRYKWILNSTSEILQDVSVKPIFINKNFLGFYAGGGVDVETGIKSRLSINAAYLYKYDGTGVNSFAKINGVNVSCSYWF
jgi:hypothetical protein